MSVSLISRKARTYVGLAVVAFALPGLAGCGGGSSGENSGAPVRDELTHVESPAGLTYANSAATYFVSNRIAPNTPSNSGGTISTYSVTPALPAGLTIDAHTGAITGAPTEVSSAAIYTVTGSNDHGSVMARVQIEVKPAISAPSTLSYVNASVIYKRGQAVTGNTPISTGGEITQFTVSPALPEGLVLNPTTGVISGTPASAIAPANYVVTGSNSAGSVKTQITIEVREAIAAPANLVYSSQNVVYVVGQAIAANLPASIGGEITAYSVSPALPAGLTLNAQTGAITGRPTSVQGSIDYLISGSNVTGTANAHVHISVIQSATGEWVPGGNLFNARAWHSATLLPDGKVLVTGGQGTGGLLDSAELYDPTTGVWTSTGKMLAARSEHVAIRLPDGRVLVAGGRGGSPLRTAELYDPATRKWTSTGFMKFGRYRASATLMPDGRVLVAGGVGTDEVNPFVPEAEVFDPSSGTWTTAGAMNVARAGHIAIALPGGKILVAGGNTQIGIATVSTNAAEIYDPASRTWALARPMNIARSIPVAAQLPDGKALIIGGTSQSKTAEIYDPVNGTWSFSGPMIMPRVNSQATRIPDGHILVTGNYDAVNEGNGTSAELFDPASGNWTATANMTDPRSMHTATLLLDGSVLVAGSYHSTQIYSSTERFRY
ncbi:kelch repeat-containing protein [Paraburkholderia hospita]|uniref:kelch repeat-containing protein n=1 Tax=Paraburkholderia hospita TaxID=169430 RepID=UPI000B349AEE|nr:kelch repeat-containing protein [Paraburkholderia hospita]OUL71439.1 hypothetical protein CA603_47095 [Paraburkholderia hospita]